jgi:hypothetical protein
MYQLKLVHSSRPESLKPWWEDHPKEEGGDAGHSAR